MATIRAVAKEAGVSITTVSRVLSDDPAFHVSDDTRNKVLKAAADLGYHCPARKKQYHIGCIMSLTYSYSDPYFNDILSGIQAYCAGHDAIISMIIDHTQFQDMDDELAKDLSKMDGLIITESPKDKLDFLAGLGKKIVFVDNYIEGYCNVGYNEFYANQLILDHIMDCGYQKIAYIGGYYDYEYFDTSPRMILFREALRENHIPYDPDLIYNCDWDHKICASQVQELMTKHPDTQVIFAGSDSLAFVILSQLRQMGYNCPEDIGVVGFNDIDLARNYAPPLTTVRLPSREMGELASRILIEQIRSGESQNMQYLLPVELKVRQSTRIISSKK